MRLIDADALKIDFYDEYETEDDEYAYGYVSKNQIDSVPSIDIVRCKECRYWIGHLTDDDGFDGEDECRWRDSEAPNADDYCSYGERKEIE